MTEGARFKFQFRSDLDINVALLDPFGNTLSYLRRADSWSSETTAEATGVHSLVFDNSFSVVTSKSVNLTYRVVPPGGR